MNWQNVVTPIKVNRLYQLLVQAGFDLEKANQLRLGFSQGFDIGYQGPAKRKNTSYNLPIRIGSKTELWNKVMKEVKAGRYAGPFEWLPTEFYVQSPFGLVPKANDKTRLIFHLSYNFGSAESDKSVNHHTPEHLCSAKYCDLDHAICGCLHLLRELGVNHQIVRQIVLTHFAWHIFSYYSVTYWQCEQKILLPRSSGSL